jgi:hypothetical protein
MNRSTATKHEAAQHEEVGEVAGGLSAEKGAGVDRRTTNVLR